MENTKNLSQSFKTGSKTIYAAFQILQKAGGQLPGREVLNKVEKVVNLTPHEKETFKKSGYIRWQSILHFYTIDCTKAGYLRKNKGVWILTDDGEKALDLGPVKLLSSAIKKYRKWKTDKDTLESPEKSTVSNGVQINKANLDQLEEEALEGLLNHIKTINAYEFQDMVAALLKAMGYYIPYISPKGKDGGLDIVAYLDPLGTKEPRIKIQVKHRPEFSIPATDIRSLKGILKSGDVGLFVTSGKFSKDAESFARDTSEKHIELIDFSRFINLWVQYYDKMIDEEKNYLPLHSIYFLGSND